MKPSKLLLIFILLLPAGILFAKEMRIVTGIMKDSSGEPLPGVNIVIKGTTTGVCTDMEGKYSIKAPLGSVLVISFVGFTTREVVVSNKNSQPAENQLNYVQNNKVVYKSTEVPVAQKDVDINDQPFEEGAAVFTAQTPSYSVINPNSSWWNDQQIVVSKISAIDFDEKNPKINLVKDEYYRIPHISFVSSVSTEQYSRLPKLQNTYAQGRPVNERSQWLGPETGEILSWGPALTNLEFDGSAYDFDTNGKLVPKGTGNGNAAVAYNPADILRNGYTFTNTLKVFMRNEKKEYSVLYSNKKNGGIFPGTSKNGNNAEIKWKRKERRFKTSLNFNFDNSTCNFLDGSPANSLIIASMLTTPPSFDLLNGSSSLKAFKGHSAWQLPDYTQRSYSPGLVNHPYWLLSNLADKESNQLQNGIATLEISLPGNFSLLTDVRYQRQENYIRNGYSQIPQGVIQPGITIRRERMSSVFASAGLNWFNRFQYSSINSSLRYDVYSSLNTLKRTDTWLTNDSRALLNFKNTRTENNLNWNTDLSLADKLVFKMSHNLSGNNRNRQSFRYAPMVAAAVNIHELVYFDFFVNQLKIKANWGFSFSNIPLNYAYGKYNFQQVSSVDFYNASFFREVIPNLRVNPEKMLKKNIGLETQLFSGKVTFEADFYENRTHDAIFPVVENDIPELQNVATIRVRGADAEMMVYQHLNYRSDARFRLIFNHYKSKVTELYRHSEIPLGGFSDVHTSLVEGYPSGVIMGSSWKRDAAGKMIIGEDGYPLVDNQMKVIATPEPDFTMGLESTFSVGSFSFSLLLDYQHGGEIWNGTRNVLSYLGLASETENGRKVLEYVFPGVKNDGSINTTPVDFANPSRPLSSNRWYRYGLTGVAGDAVEDASCFRIREISVSYQKRKGQIRPVFTVFVRNPVILTRYSGVDPNITLWEKPNTAGMDLFNLPSVSSLGVSVKIQL